MLLIQNRQRVKVFKSINSINKRNFSTTRRLNMDMDSFVQADINALEFKEILIQLEICLHNSVYHLENAKQHIADLHHDLYFNKEVFQARGVDFLNDHLNRSYYHLENGLKSYVNCKAHYKDLVGMAHSYPAGPKLTIPEKIVELDDTVQHNFTVNHMTFNRLGPTLEKYRIEGDETTKAFIDGTLPRFQVSKFFLKEKF